MSQSATNWISDPPFMQYDTFGVKVKVSSGNPSGLGLRIFASILIKAVAKPRICLRFCMGLMHGTDIGFRNLTYVVDEPDAFNLNIEAKQK